MASSKQPAAPVVDPTVCKAEECSAPKRGRLDYCERHQRRLQRNGTLDRARAPRAGYSP